MLDTDPSRMSEQDVENRPSPLPSRGNPEWDRHPAAEAPLQQAYHAESVVSQA